MKTVGKKLLRVLIILIAVLAILTIAFVTVCRHTRRQTVLSAEEYLTKLEQLIPPSNPGLISATARQTMPMLEVDGTDFVGILEYADQDHRFPVYGVFETSPWSRLPARYAGSAAAGNLVISGTTEQGQFDFAEKLDVGARFVFTDVLGNTFRYSVQKIEHISRKRTEYLTDSPYPLTLFVRFSRAQYLVIRCGLGEGEFSK